MSIRRIKVDTADLAYALDEWLAQAQAEGYEQNVEEDEVYIRLRNALDRTQLDG